MLITTLRLATGQFEVHADGNPTGYAIINGSLGSSGRNTINMYGIVNPQGTVAWVGSLASCKRLVARRLSKVAA